MKSLKLQIHLANEIEFYKSGVKGELTVPPTATVGMLQFKLRLMLKNITQSDAVFLFFDNQHLYSNSTDLLKIWTSHEIDNVLHVFVYRENVFGGNIY